MKDKRLIYLIIPCIFVIGISLIGCALIKPENREAEKARVLAENYEEERNFKQAIQAWKDLQKIDPDNKEIQTKIIKMESNLASCVQRHIRLGKKYLKKREWERSRKEFLTVLFLDPEQQEAFDYLRRLFRVRHPGDYKDIIQEPPEIEQGKYLLHTLKKGESLSLLAKKYYGDMMKYHIITHFNDIDDINRIEVGQKIKIPVIKGMKTFNGGRMITVGPPLSAEPASRKPSDKTYEAIKKPEKEKGPSPADKTDAAAEKTPSVDKTGAAAEKTPPLDEEKKAAEMDEKLLGENFNKGVALFQEDKFSEAIEKFQHVIQICADHPSAIKYIYVSKKIIALSEKGVDLYSGRKYGEAYDEFSKVLTLKPNAIIANRNIDSLLVPMTTEAKFLLYDEQSPCETISLVKKVLKRDPHNKQAQELLKEASILANVLNLQCDQPEADKP